MHISLVEFSVENYKVFKERAVFSMLARKNDKHTFESNGENLLKTSLIYGPNASGKTSLLDAFSLIKAGIIVSANLSTNPKDRLGIPYFPFLGLKNTQTEPSSFEVVFSTKGSYSGVYRYGFSILPDRITKEQMSVVLANGKEEILFSRTEQKIAVSGNVFASVKDLTETTRKEALFLSTAAQINNKFALGIVGAFRDINIISGVRGQYEEFTIRKFKEDPEYKTRILEYLKTADFCIFDGLTEEIDVPALDEIKDDADSFSARKRMEKGNVLIFKHPVYGEDKKKIDDFKLLLEDESTGTQKFLSVLGPIIDTLIEGKVLFIDEFDNSLHPFLTKLTIDLFESSEINKKDAQLIVTTHDVSLLSYKDDFIKDQFWFTEKDELGAAKLFSLAEFKLRNDTEFSKKYLEGRFGALPFVIPLEK
ncbi:MAG: ATP-binding protein [Candidatus Pacebacteria bacterium]|nr:ATP-binding protein [Candidatus Paceibacterota bacterium]